MTRCSNNYGPYQFPEKFIPLMIAQAMAGQKLPVYGKGANVRDWIHVSDHCSALDTVLQHGREGEVYNIGGGCEMQNLDVVKLILNALGRSEELIQFVTDRPGHDLRYAINCEKLCRELGWYSAGYVRQRSGARRSRGIARISRGWTTCAAANIAITISDITSSARRRSRSKVPSKNPLLFS